MLVRQARRVSDRAAKVRETTIDSALAAALGTEDPRQVAKVIATLENLAKRLGRK
jgi:hypothetical protein